MHGRMGQKILQSVTRSLAGERSAKNNRNCFNTSKPYFFLLTGEEGLPTGIFSARRKVNNFSGLGIMRVVIKYFSMLLLFPEGLNYTRQNNVYIRVH